MKLTFFHLLTLIFLGEAAFAAPCVTRLDQLNAFPATEVQLVDRENKLTPEEKAEGVKLLQDVVNTFNKSKWPRALRAVVVKNKDQFMTRGAVLKVSHSLDHIGHAGMLPLGTVLIQASFEEVKALWVHEMGHVLVNESFDFNRQNEDSFIIVPYHELLADLVATLFLKDQSAMTHALRTAGHSPGSDHRDFAPQTRITFNLGVWQPMQAEHNLLAPVRGFIGETYFQKALAENKLNELFALVLNASKIEIQEIMKDKSQMKTLRTEDIFSLKRARASAKINSSLIKRIKKLAPQFGF